MRRGSRLKCARCRRWMRRSTTPATPLKRAPRPHDRLCVECAPETVAEFVPVSRGQISALHAKCNTLGRQTERPASVWKDEVKRLASEHFEIEVGSFLDLSYAQASWCLDWLDEKAHEPVLA